MISPQQGASVIWADDLRLAAAGPEPAADLFLEGGLVGGNQMFNMQLAWQLDLLF